MLPKVIKRIAGAPEGAPAYLAGDDWFAVPDLVSGRWTTARRVGVVTVINTNGLAQTYIETTCADSEEFEVRLALTLAPAESDRHDELADGMRAAAGRVAARIQNATLRARLLDTVDGWEAMAGRLIDESADGSLHAGDDLYNLLLVTCPSTGRRYCLRVPTEHKTARAARLWTLHDAEPEVET